MRSLHRGSRRSTTRPQSRGKNVTRVIETTEVLTGLGAYLASVALAHYRDDQTGYRDDPSRPANLFGDDEARISTYAVVPDTAVVLRVVGRDDALCTWDVAMTFRTTGVTPLGVEALADAVHAHFDATMGQDAWTYQPGTVVTMPTIDLGNGVEVIAVQQVSRGTTQPTSPANHKGSRWVRTDVWRLTVHGE
jgi:hypothetical protein